MALVISQDFTSCLSDIKCVLGKTILGSVLTVHQKHRKGLLKYRLLGPIPRVSNSADRGWTQKSAVLTSSQVMLLLLFCGPLLDNWWSCGSSNSTSGGVHLRDYVDGGIAFASF